MRINRWFFLLLLTITLINYPNPFNPKGKQITTFEVTADASQEAKLYLYDMAAQLLWQTNLSLEKGLNRFSWNGYNQNNELVGSGIYLCRLVDPSTYKTLAKTKVWVINR